MSFFVTLSIHLTCLQIVRRNAECRAFRKRQLVLVQNGCDPPSWILNNFIFETVSTVQRVIVRHHANLRGDWLSRC